MPIFKFLPSVHLGMWLGLWLTVSVGPAWGCPFCSAPSLTLTEQVTQSDAAALAQWIGGKSPKEGEGGTTDCEIVEVLHQPEGGKLAVKGKVTLVRYRPAKVGDQFLLLGTKGNATIDWGAPMEMTTATYDYIKHAPKPELPAATRMEYFLKFLEHPDQLISTDAYGEFANTAYGEIVKVAKFMPRDNLRKWVVDPQVSPSRLGLYGLMLGLCGTSDDIAVLEKKIFESTEEFRLGIDGVMGGYLLLSKTDGLTKLDEAKLANKSAPFSETYAAMQALRFMWQYGDGLIPADRLKASMRILLDRPELADLVIADLARWKDWSIQSRLMALYDAEEYDVPSIKRAVVRFMLAATKDLPADQAGSATPPEHVTAAKGHLAELEQKDPKTVSEAKRFFLIK